MSDLRKAINEIEKTIDEIRHNGEHHAEFVQSNGELVISGLEIALDILNSTQPEPCEDTVSRKAAIDALRNAQRLVLAFGYHNALDAIFDLPSAQPEIIRCKDCNYHVKDEYGEIKYCDFDLKENETEFYRMISADYFCADAKRRDDE